MKCGPVLERNLWDGAVLDWREMGTYNRQREIVPISDLEEEVYRTIYSSTCTSCEDIALKIDRNETDVFKAMEKLQKKGYISTKGKQISCGPSPSIIEWHKNEWRKLEYKLGLFLYEKRSPGTLIVPTETANAITIDKMAEHLQSTQLMAREILNRMFEKEYIVKIPNGIFFVAQPKENPTFEEEKLTEKQDTIDEISDCSEDENDEVSCANNTTLNHVYILTNPAMPHLVKIGFTKNLKQRIHSFNAETGVPLPFSLYGYYDTDSKQPDKFIHSIIDSIAPELRCVSADSERLRRREFYRMEPETAYAMFENIANLTGTQDRLHLVRGQSIPITTRNAESEKMYGNDNRLNLKSIGHAQTSCTR